MACNVGVETRRRRKGSASKEHLVIAVTERIGIRNDFVRSGKYLQSLLLGLS
jgi:hypothetical protein